MTIIQILLSVFVIFAISRAVLRFRSGGLSAVQLVMWLVFWLAVGLVVVRPETASDLARVLGVGRGADVVVYLALAGIFYLLFRMFAKTEDLERQITRLVRDLSLKDLKEEPHGTDSHHHRQP